MSAFICSDMHISIIANEVSDYFRLDFQELANKLKSINIDSVNYRYGENTRKSKCKQLLGDKEYTKDDIAKLIDSFNYQACEKLTPDFKAYSIMLECWIKENNANPDNGKYWSI